MPIFHRFYPDVFHGGFREANEWMADNTTGKHAKKSTLGYRKQKLKCWINLQII